MSGRPDRPITVALVVPLHGSEQMYGPSCTLSARLAADEINSDGGLLGREVRLHIVDSAGAPYAVADEVDRLITADRVDAVVGWHLSALRTVLARRVAGRIPYVFTALYEGGESTPGVFCTGETPGRQLYPALAWMAREVSVRRWFVVGNDYRWPRETTTAVRRFARSHPGVSIEDEIYVDLGTTDFAGISRRIEQSTCDGVLMLLVGRDGVEFNRRFAAHGLDAQCARLTPLMDETMLLETGIDDSRDVFSTAGFFETLSNEDSLAFGARYVERFGPDAPVLNSPGESCYEGMQLLAGLVRRAGSADVGRICEIADGTRYHGPRGEIAVAGRHVDQPIYMAVADGSSYDVLASL
ncbi:amino acid/amide ABC transporter substrate-binding protein (HAAT family) [Pseudonocardia sediminis]|uniref:Amino acid/amide ABC transporter substrate-binding protein (HAAT family) n=1 Tax=Pseudonocardia sediminis TaxID=1397368 RepID=A0A4Q7UXQ0_PSEST|nr:substrate-binding domain-containing protein [Pseudonocardia sediminis]RZT84919.1 amino acid/amide ABC transporter substrate-binding protein (HAAT family) [Pseudonocardia sediminis]